MNAFQTYSLIHFALLAGAFPLRAQFRGGPSGAPPPVPSVEQVASAVPLNEAQRAQLAPLLKEAAAAQKRVAASRIKLAKLQAALPEKPGAVLSDSQKEKLPMALFNARFGRGPRVGPPPAN